MVSYEVAKVHDKIWRLECHPYYLTKRSMYLSEFCNHLEAIVEEAHDCELYTDKSYNTHMTNIAALRRCEKGKFGNLMSAMKRLKTKIEKIDEEN